MCCGCNSRKRQKEIRNLLRDVRDTLWRMNQAVELRFTAHIAGQPALKGITMLTLTDVEKVQLSIQPVDAKGNPAKVDGPPVWSTSDETIATVMAAEDGLSATVLANGPLGTVQVTVKADADLGAGVAELVGILEIEVVASAAVALQVSAGTPSPQ